MKKTTKKDDPKWYIKQDYLARYDWLDKFLDDDFRFGTNCFMNNDEPIKLFMKLSNLGAGIKIVGDESVLVSLPQDAGECFMEGDKREQIYLHIITMTTHPTEAIYSKKNGSLRLTWS